MAGENFQAGQYEFQCLHGMGEPLYEEVVGARRSSTGRAASMRRSARTRPCSPIWCAACWRTAPTPRSSTRSPIRTSPIDALLADPVGTRAALQPVGAPHPTDRAAARPVRPGAAEFAGPRPRQRAGARLAAAARRQASPHAAVPMLADAPPTAAAAGEQSGRSARRRRHGVEATPARSTRPGRSDAAGSLAARPAAARAAALLRGRRPDGARLKPLLGRSCARPARPSPMPSAR